MRVRFQAVIYQSGNTSASREHHHRDVRGAMFPLGEQYGYIQPGGVWRPAMDIHETPNAVLVKIELAGVAEESVEITLYSNAVVVTGSRVDDSASDEETYFHEAQIRYGPFRADAFLSTPIQPEMASAVYQNGLLRITLPRRAVEAAPPDDLGQPSVTGESDETSNDESGLSEASGHTLAGDSELAEIHETAFGRLFYSFAKETSHA
jgi:HSP20 family molecular chaperone IbpA